MAKRVFVTAERVPGYTSYIVQGKEYELVNPTLSKEGGFYGELNEAAWNIFIHTPHCAHLDGLPWTVRIEE